MAEAKFTPRQLLLNEIACALTDHMTEGYDAGHFVDLTTGGVTFIQREYMLDDITPEELVEYQDWEQECIKEYLEHDLRRIECVPSYESFHVMEHFVESRPEREQRRLIWRSTRIAVWWVIRGAMSVSIILPERHCLKNANGSIFLHG